MNTRLFWTMIPAIFSLYADAASVQSARCYPADAPADWPIRAVYLHGQFKGSAGAGDTYIDLEDANRARLESAAKALKIRIAVPLAPVQGRNDWRQWLKIPVSKMRSMAREACDGAEISEDATLIAFSNGAKRANEIAAADCSQISSFGQVWSIGAPEGTPVPHCANLKNDVPHVFPPLDALKAELQKTIPATRSVRPGESQAEPEG